MKLGRLLKRDVKEAEAIWHRDRQQHLEQRGIATAYARFLRLIEVRKVSPLMMEALHDAFGITHGLARKLANCKPVAFDEVKGIAKNFLNKQEFDDIESTWVYEKEAIEREGFPDAFVRVRDEVGITNNDIVEALQVKPSAYRGKKERRPEGFKPSHVVRGTYQYVSFSPLAPAGALVEIIARPDVECTIDDEQMNERRYLRELFMRDRAAHYQRRGSRVAEPELRLTREFWGVEPKLLKGIGGLSGEEILRVEMGDKTASPKIINRLLCRAETLGKARAQAAKQCREAIVEDRTKKANATPRSMEEFVEVLCDRVGGWGKVIQMNLPDPDSDEKAHIGALTFQAIGVGKGKHVPPWPVVEKIVRRCGADVHPELEEDWYEKYPQQLRTGDGKKIKTPLARGIMTAIGHHVAERKDIAAALGMNPQVVTKPILQLSQGIFPEWRFLSRILSGIGMGIDDPIYRYLQILHSKQGDVRSSLIAWRKEIRRRDLDPKEYEYKLGLRPKERLIRKL